MKFAVLEYTSKSGKVWHHTDDHPNYLANPITELDPTSFGCYVSALKGEHIPLKGLIVGPVEPVSKITAIYRKIQKRMTGNWPASYSLKYLQQFDSLMVVHQLSDAHEINRAIKRLKSLSPHPRIVGVPTQPYGILKDAFEKSPEDKREFIDFMNVCDVFISIVEDTTSWYQGMTSTRVVYVPQPYPVEHAMSFFKPVEQKEKVILVAGVTQRDDIKKGQIVAREFQKMHPEYLIKVPKVGDLDYDFSNLQDARFEILPFEEWQDHLKTLASTALVINTDYTFTRGRLQADCAAVGTATIGANSDAQRDLFHQFIGASSDTLMKLVGQAEALLEDTALYTRTCDEARKQLVNYNYQMSADRIKALL